MGRTYSSSTRQEHVKSSGTIQHEYPIFLSLFMIPHSLWLYVKFKSIEVFPSLLNQHFYQHFYHWWGEIILGSWRIYSKLVYGRKFPLPFPARFILPVSIPRHEISAMYLTAKQVIDKDEWKDRAGIDAPLMRAAFPNASIETSNYWQNLIRLNTTIVFERAMLVSRSAAHRQ